MKKKGKRMAAMLGVLLLVTLYIGSFFIGIFSNEENAAFLKAALYSVIFIPIFIYIFILLCKMFGKKREDKEK